MGAFETLEAEATACTLCPLHRTRTQVVFGVGSATADVVFVGEAPGYHEDHEGEPFVGKSGALLTRLLHEIGLAREDVYIANILKCRPPDNRDPLPGEIEVCTPYLDRQLELIDPRVVVTLGNFATKYLLETSVGVTRLRGNRYRFRGRVLVPTYHPAAVLRGGTTKLEEIRGDFGLVRRTIDTRRAVPAPATAGTAPPPTGRQASPPNRADREAAEETSPAHVEQLGLF